MMRKFFLTGALLAAIVIIAPSAVAQHGPANVVQSTPDASQKSKPQTATAIPVILDTDIGNDIDDTEALALLCKYADEGRINFLGICLNKSGRATAEFTDIITTWYGHPEVPVGVVRNEKFSGHDADSCYTGKVCRLKNADGSPLFARSMGKRHTVAGARKSGRIGRDSAESAYDNLPDAHILYRQLLANQPDSSVVIISIGFLTNLSRLLDTAPDEYSPLNGRELVARKVRLLSIMAGRFKDGQPEYNVVIDIPSAQKIFSEWPGRIVSSPFEIGEAVRFPAACVENGFGWVPAHPLKEAYIRYQKMPYNNWMFDPTAVVYAVEGPSYFTETEEGTISVDDKGTTTFASSVNGQHSYLKVDADQAAALVEYFKSYLTSKP